MNSFRFLRSTVRSRSISARKATDEAARAVRGAPSSRCDAALFVAFVTSGFVTAGFAVIRAGPFR